MCTQLYVFLLLISSPVLMANGLKKETGNPMRTWTEADTGRKVVAKIVDKSLDGLKVRIQTRKGKSFWLPCKKLSKADQDYVREWVKPVDYLSVRIVGKRKGIKDLLITVHASKHPVKVVVHGRFGTRKPLRCTCKQGQQRQIRVTTTNKYRVEVWEKGVLVDQESHNRKTGL